MTSSTRNEPRSIRDISYYRQRYRNRVFAKLVDFISEQSDQRKITRRDIAERLNKDPAQITRLLSQPGNMTLDTISDLLLALDAEAEPPEIVLFEHRSPANYVHPLVARVADIAVTTDTLRAESSAERELRLETPSDTGISFAEAAAS